MKRLSATLLILLMCRLLPDVHAMSAEEDSVVVNLPWGKSIVRELSTSGAVTVTPDMLKYPSVDIRNALTGLIPGLEVIENHGDINYGNFNYFYDLTLASGNLSFVSKGMTNAAICIVDDVPVPLSNLMLVPEQIESISFLSDVADKALYGPRASAGALIIKTRRGNYNTPMEILAEVESGVSFMDRFPEWVNGVDYARMNNMAREASGYQTLYANPEDYARGDVYSRTLPNVDYRKLMLRNYKPVTKAGLHINGGTANIGYIVSFSGVSEGGAFKRGPENDYNHLNFLSRINARIGNWIEASVGTAGNISFYRHNSLEFSDWRKVPSIIFPLSLGTNSGENEDVAEGRTIYPVSKTFTNNYWAQLVEGGGRTQKSRSVMFNASVDIDFSFLLPGLKSKTYVNLNVANGTVSGKDNDYLAYYWDPVDGIGELSSHKGVLATSKSTFNNMSYQGLNLYERLSYGISRAGHVFNADATYYIQDIRNRATGYYVRQQNLIMSADYNWKQRYSLIFNVNYAGASTLPEANRYGWFPSGGAAWIISNEPLMKDVTWVNHLKLRAQAGVLGSYSVLNSSHYLYDAKYSLNSGGMSFGPAKNDRWFGTLTESPSYSTVSRFANPDLDWERIYEADFGLEATIFDHLSVMASGFWMKRKGIITDVTSVIPNLYGMSGVAVYDNYNEVSFTGADLSVRYFDNCGDWSWSIEATATTFKGINDKVESDALNIYEWTKVTGQVTDAYRGFVCTGKYTSEDEIAGSAVYDSSVRVGDLKYADLNEDGKIDSNDKRILGNTHPRLKYAVNLYLKWRDLDLTVIGTGRAFFDVSLVGNEYYTNGSGDGLYSVWVRDNLGGAYPRLSYTKATSNFQASDFWLRDGSWFKIQNVELGYNIPIKKGNKVGVDAIKVMLRGANLATISGIKDTDPEAMSSGVTNYPLYRTFTAGVKFTF